MHDNKYVGNQDPGDYRSIVGDVFKCASHGDFYRNIHETITEEFTEGDTLDTNYTWRTARNGAWSMLDITFPNMTMPIVTDKIDTSIGNRIIALHGVDGSCSNQVFFGAIDFFCTNGMIRGQYDKIRRQNTPGFSLHSLIGEQHTPRTDLDEASAQMHEWT